MLSELKIKDRRRYVIEGIGLYEVLVFDISTLIEEPFERIFCDIKDLGVFKMSEAYLEFMGSKTNLFENDEYGNFNFARITWQDYSNISYDSVFKLLKIPKRQQLETYDLLNLNEEFYVLNISLDNKEKLATTCIWENFQSLIGIDRKNKILHLITMGKD